MYFAVNSGNSESMVESYFKLKEVPFPIIVDSNRNFEKMFGIKKISLTNIWREILIAPDGTKAKPKEFENLLKTAQWRIDPEGIVEKHKEAWKALEFGQMEKGIKLFDGIRAPKKPSAELDSYEKLKSNVSSYLKDQIAKASSYKEDGKLYQSAVLYTYLIDTFKKSINSEDLKECQAMLRALKKNKTVSKELSLKKKFDALFKKLEAASKKGDISKQKSAVKALRSLIEKYLKYESAQQAKKRLG